MKLPLWLRSIDFVVRIAVGLVAILVALMMINLILDSIGRNVFRTPLPGTLELVSYLWMPALAVLALGYAQLRDEQIRVTILTENTGPTLKRKLDIAAEVIGGIVALVLAILAAQVFLRSLEIGRAPDGARWLLMWPGQLLVAVGFSICVLAAVARIYRLATGSETADTAQIPEGSAFD